MKQFIILINFLASTGMAQNFELDVIKVVANCQEQDYVDVIPGDSIFTIAIQGTSYSPKCLRIKKGTALNIQASSRHPLQGLPVMENSIVNPIYNELGGAVVTNTYTFNEVGVFGYYCTAHGNNGGLGMAGAIYVSE
jgi:plastocyanin